MTEDASCQLIWAGAVVRVSVLYQLATRQEGEARLWISPSVFFLSFIQRSRIHPPSAYDYT